jgi:hypothetical protein
MDMLKKLWRIISETETIVSIYQAIISSKWFPVAVAIMAAAISIWNEYYPILIIFFTLGAILIAQIIRNRAKESSIKYSMPIEYLKNQAERERKYPPEITFTASNQVEVSWLSGSGVHEKRVAHLTEGGIRTLILPDPNSNSVSALQSSFGERKGGFKFDEFINMTTKLAQDSTHHHIDILWYKEFTGMALTIVNADSPDGWMNIELIHPFMEPADRPTIHITKRNHLGEFNKWIKAYKEMKKHCVTKNQDATKS